MAIDTDKKTLLEITLGRSSMGIVCGAAAAILAILGLAHLLPVLLVAISAIVLGGALFFRGAVISAEYSKLLAHLSGSTSDKIELGGGISVEIMTGVAGVVLGILALLGLVPDTLLAIAIITFGAGVIMGAGVTSRLNSLKIGLANTAGASHFKIAEEIVSAAMGTQMLAGAAAIVLGILSLIGFDPITLNLIGILVLGCATLLSGSAVAGKIVELMRVS